MFGNYVFVVFYLIYFLIFFNLSSWLIPGRDALSPSFTTGGCTHLGPGPYLWHCWTSWVSHASTYWACPVLSGWHPIPWSCQPHHSASCHLQTFCSWLGPTILSVVFWNRIGPNMDLRGRYSSLISILPLDFLKLKFLSIYVVSTPFLISSLSCIYPRTLISALHAIPGSFFSVK